MTEFSDLFEKEFSGWVSWPEVKGAHFHVRYLNLEASEALVKGCQVQEWDKRTHQKVDRVDEDKFRRRIGDLLLEWRGLTVGGLSGFLKAKSNIPDDTVIPFDPKMRLELLRSVPGLASFILDSARELHLMAEKAEGEEVKN